MVLMPSRETLKLNLWRAEPVILAVSGEPQAYPEALEVMEAHVAAIAAGQEPERVWLLQHPALYTAGTSAKSADLVSPNRFPVFETGRGGQYTYHGPGQRVAYVMLNLAKRGSDVRAFVAALENWLIATLAEFDVTGERREDRVGIWVRHDGGERDHDIQGHCVGRRQGVHAQADRHPAHPAGGHAWHQRL